MNRVLVVDDEAPMRAALEASLARCGWQVKTASGTSEAIAQFRLDPCPLVITDMRMPDGNGLQVMDGVRSLRPDTAVIFLTAFGNVPEAVKAMRQGACDYLVKPIAFEQLQEAARRVLRERPGAGAQGAGIIGQSPAIVKLMERARQVAATDVDVLLQAESGTGKELFARLIHQSSKRRSRPLVAVNCAAFPDTLLESELFGHVRGAFTGASTAKPGRFELADTGTLLLDEVSEMPLQLQPKLLRVLQEREVDRLGDTRPLAVDVRVVATTNHDMSRLVEEGKFRSDLYYRLNVVPLKIPPLREHPEDIPELVRHFIRKYSSPASSMVFSADLMQRLHAYSWPGNIRELENLVRRILALSAGPVADVELLEGTDLDRQVLQAEAAPAATTLREIERQVLERTLESTGGNRTRAAEILGVSIRTVRNKIRGFGLPPRRAA